MLKDLEPAYISLYISFNQVEKLAKQLIAKEIGRVVPVKVEGDDDKDALRIRVEIDDSSLSDDEAIYLSSRGYSLEQPYRNAHFVLEALTEGVPYEILPMLGHDDEEFGTYFLVEIPYHWYITRDLE
ncbi:hypothetical protein [Sporosarcina highlanderae]|uniref:Uncharacterized protein n=1 Tax=Sporosarcina highlanderae TaxID=3035916 RepID=A0ABT8JSS7_9BACL|nr:hypothetical protein [Sporosarcina highlanderae]MDN4608208.1 hypothetical protein [Sporosarcina highlanderae]